MVPDEVLVRAADVEKSKKTVHATLELLDLPAMARAGSSRGLASQFLARLREMEALLVVLRAFDDPAVPHDESGLDPVSQAEELLLELALADAEVFERRLERLAKEATGDSSKRPAAAAFACDAERDSRGRVVFLGDVDGFGHGRDSRG